MLASYRTRICRTATIQSGFVPRQTIKDPRWVSLRRRFDDRAGALPAHQRGLGGRPRLAATNWVPDMEALQTDVISRWRAIAAAAPKAVDRRYAGDEPRRFIVQLLPVDWRCGRTRRKRLCMSSGPVNCEARDRSCSSSGTQKISENWSLLRVLRSCRPAERLVRAATHGSPRRMLFATLDAARVKNSSHGRAGHQAMDWGQLHRIKIPTSLDAVRGCRIVRPRSDERSGTGSRAGNAFGTIVRPTLRRELSESSIWRIGTDRWDQRAGRADSPAVSITTICCRCGSREVLPLSLRWVAVDAGQRTSFTYSRPPTRTGDERRAIPT